MPEAGNVRPMVILVRHGETKLNDPKEERLRGWLPVPLDEEGKKQSEEIGYVLLGLNIRKLYYSPIVRAGQTAEIIYNVLTEYGQRDVEAVPVDDLKTWNLGVLHGQPVSSIEPILRDLYVNRDKVPEGGETFNSFFHRYIDRLRAMFEEAKADPRHAIVAVGHTAIFRATDAWLKAGAKGYEVDQEVLLSPKYNELSPGSLMFLVAREDGTVAKDEESQGVHQAGPSIQKPAMDVPDASPVPVPPTPGGQGFMPVEQMPDDRVTPATGAYPRAPGDKPQPYLAYQSLEEYMGANQDCPVCKRPLPVHTDEEWAKCEAAYTGLRDQPENYLAPEGPIAR